MKQLLNIYQKLAKADQMSMFGEGPGAKSVADPLKFQLDIADKVAYMDKLKEMANLCTRCSLGQVSRQKGLLSVLSRGAPTAQVMIVAEAPAKEELQQGLPLCGPSGQLWHEMLKEAGIDATKLYQTNALLCRLNKVDSKRTEEQLHACAPFLEHQLYVVRPRFVIALGQTAMTRMGVPKGNSPLADEVTVVNYQKIPVTWVAHPAYTLRNLPAKPAAVAKLIKIRELLAGSYGVDISISTLRKIQPYIQPEVEEL